MGRAYGKIGKKTAKAGRGRKVVGGPLKIKLRGKGGAPLSMQEIRDGLFEAARRLQRYEQTHRAAWVTLYLTMIDEDDREAVPGGEDEWVIFPYKCAADEFDA